jgi:tetratricopeptide (TPR) repeat protein
MNSIKYFLPILFFSLMLPLQSAAQIDEYRQANLYFEQQNYAEALPIFEQLYQENPRSLVFFNRYTESLIGLKEFEKAEAVAREQIGQNRFDLQATLKLAEIQHLKGDREAAIQLWLQEAESNRTNIQAIYSIGNSLVNRMEYETATEVYRIAQDALNDSNLFLSEIANTQMRAGNFEEAVRVYFQLIIQSPDQMSLVQQRFLRMRDDELYTVAAIELEDILLQLDYNNQAYSTLYQLLSWLLIETEQYQRAFVVAKRFETDTTFPIYSLFSLGRQLRSSKEYELASQSFQYYVNENTDALRYRAMEELGNTYVQWGEYINRNRTESLTKADSLFSLAYNTFTSILNQSPQSNNRQRVLASTIDLSFDHYKDSQLAADWIAKLRELTPENESPYLLYAEGRKALFEGDHIIARQQLTRADKSTDDSNLSEKARYYLSLSDFYSGDYEFAQIQLKSLSRRYTSYYANNAIKIEMWINQGLRADSSGTVLDRVSSGLYSLELGKYKESIKTLEPLLVASGSMFADDLVVELTNELPVEFYGHLYVLNNRLLNNLTSSPQRERLFWNKITLSEYFLKNEQPPTTNIDLSLDINPDEIDIAPEDLFILYEDFLIEFPSGFYAPYVRERLNSNQQIST